HQVEGRSAQHLARSEVVGGSHSFGCRSRRPARRFVTCRRVPQQECPKHCHHKKDPAQNLERSAPAKARDQVVGRQRPKDRRPCAVSAHGQAHGQAALVRKPFRHDWNRSRIPESVAQSSKHTRIGPMIEILKGPNLSCNRPATMNVSANTTTAMMNTLEVSARFQWNSFSSGATNTLQAYSEPSARFMETPPTTCHQRFKWVDATSSLATVFLLYRNMK